MSQNKVDELTLDAVRQLQKLAKDQGFKRLPDEQAFMDDLSGEDDGPRIIMRRRFTTLSDAELAKARIWWEGLPEGEQMRRRDDAASRREAFGIELPEDDDDEDWPDGEGWAAVCYVRRRARLKKGELTPFSVVIDSPFGVFWSCKEHYVPQNPRNTLAQNG